MLGAYVTLSNVVNKETIWEAIQEVLGQTKQHLLDINVKALEEGVKFWKANFEYHYNLTNRPPLVVNAFHEWGFKGGRSSHRYEAAAYKAFLEDVLVKNKKNYPNTYVITFHQLIKYMKKNSLASIIAEGNGQDKAEETRYYPDF